MPDNTESSIATLYTSLPRSMTEQDWRNVVSLLRLRLRESEQRLLALEVADRAISHELEEVASRCETLWTEDAERRWKASTTPSDEA